jgi:AAA15 family ATPase/GTPase
VLLRFQFSNFRSFLAEQELSLIATSLDSADDLTFRNPAVQERVLPAVAIYGANASGKSNVLKALGFMASAVKFSHRTWDPGGGIPLEPFEFRRDADSSSMFVADFIIENIRYQYGFRATVERITDEWLYVFPKGKRQTWFRRRVDSGMSFSTKMQGENRSIEQLMRKNSLFLSTAAQNNHQALLPIFKWFSEKLTLISSDRTVLVQRAADLCRNDKERGLLSPMVSAADFGISEVDITEEKMPERSREMLEAIISVLRSKGLFEEPNSPGPDETQTKMRFIHRFGDSSHAFDLENESDGTLAFFGLLAPAIHTIRSGGVLCIDELDRSLHSLLAVQLVRLFTSGTSNATGAQLIFSTHDTSLLCLPTLRRDQMTLRRDQIWFTEKDRNGESHLYALTEFNPRKNENLENGYLQGRYGAVPFLNAEAFLSALATDNGRA